MISQRMTPGSAQVCRAYSESRAFWSERVSPGRKQTWRTIVMGADGRSGGGVEGVTEVDRVMRGWMRGGTEGVGER